MADPVSGAIVQGGLSEDEKRSNVVRLVFDGCPDRFADFCHVIEEFVPTGVAAVIHGSAVTGHRWNDGAPFDAGGQGTSDVDLTLVGAPGLSYFVVDGFYVPGVHSKPLSDRHPDIAPGLVPLRQRLSAMAGRPVSIQAARHLVTRFRGEVLAPPYLTLFVKPSATGPQWPDVQEPDARPPDVPPRVV